MRRQLFIRHSLLLVVSHLVLAIIYFLIISKLIFSPETVILIFIGLLLLFLVLVARSRVHLLYRDHAAIGV